MSKRQKRSHSPSPDLVAIQQGPAHKRTRSRHGGIAGEHEALQSASGSSELRPMNTLPRPASHLRPAKQLFICGSGAFGQLGMGSTEEATTELHRPRLHVWFEIAVQGESHMLGAERGAGIECAVAGGMHSLVIDELGRVWSWGVNDHGALGRQTTNVEDPDASGQLIDPEILEYTPMIITKLAEEGFRAVQAAAGDSISVALSDKGAIRAWGCFRAADGLLGFQPPSIIEREKARRKAKAKSKPKNAADPSTAPQLDPLPISHLSEERFVQIACGSNHVLALSERGIVYCWGNGQHAELGRKIVERHKIMGLVPTRLLIQRLVCVAAGAYHSFAIDENGVVYAWGLNSFRQTGVQFAEDYEGDRDVVWLPMRVSALDPKVLGNGRRVVQICGGEHHSLFLLNDGTVYGCGRCDASELGLGDDHPEMIALAQQQLQQQQEQQQALAQAQQNIDPSSSKGTGLPQEYISYISSDPEVDRESSISTSSSGLIKCISLPTLIRFPPPPTPSNPDPPLPPFSSSLSSTLPSSAPANPMKRISADSRHSFALSASGHVYAWGLGLVGELGLGRKVSEQKTPRRVRSATLDELFLMEDGRKEWKWTVEDVCTGGQHTIFVARPRV
ncbi:hypothetical protein ACEPAF_7313 [Sanghuangporus sanghuang]